MNTFQIHLSGIVQGVGFRPFVYNLAIKKNIAGWVCNTSSGVYIRMNGTKELSDSFLKEIINNAPDKSIITSHSVKEIDHEVFSQFTIIKSFEGDDDARSITPDYALCEDCLEELNTNSNRRFNYAFITCSTCGPRYSIIDKLPYDRDLTSMHEFEMCDTCKEEYEDSDDRRFFSQTNSCPDCGIKLNLYSYASGNVNASQEQLIQHACDAILNGEIIAIKGIGGYMLLADARNINAIRLLRKRKNRPDKPFAVMVKDLEIAKSLAKISAKEEAVFLSDSAPILLLNQIENNIIPRDEIAPGLNEIGLLRPYTPLHQLIVNQLNFPLIATSGNVSGSPIIYKDEDIIEGMRGIADCILSNNRRINSAQDDSVIRFTENDEAIIIRRSRGLAPNVLGLKENNKESILALGAMLKSTISMLYKGNVIVSQYIGNSNSYETQLSYLSSYSQLRNTLDFKADIVLSDKHPGYFTSELAEEMSDDLTIKNHKIQHHEAHFTAVLGEHTLWNKEVLGIIWDGTGLGNDANIWGGEFFHYKNGIIERADHFPYQKHILGDKMVNEPRIAAFSFFNQIEASESVLRKKFSDLEWETYKKLYDKTDLLTSSIGRLFDAVASILNLKDISTFHGQAAMLLEASALSCNKRLEVKEYKIVDDNGDFELNVLLEEILKDIDNTIDTNIIAARFHHSLVAYIKNEVQKQKVKNIAFSGGVFQNKFLVELIINKFRGEYTLYFNKQFSPNDESISFGQLMHYLHIR